MELSVQLMVMAVGESAAAARPDGASGNVGRILNEAEVPLVAPEVALNE